MKSLVRWIGLLSLACALFKPVLTHAAPEESPQAGSTELANPFSDFVPFEDEYDIDEDERFMYFGRFFGVSLGTGLHRFTGNIGKLYNTALPVMDFRLLYFFDFRLAGVIGITSANHAFVGRDQGPVDISLLRLNADLKYYFNTRNAGAAITAASPYIIGGVSQTFRSQSFGGLNQAGKDTAVGVSAGAGMEFAIKPRKTALGVEARMHQFFFKDRYDDTYINSGVEDTTGNMFSLLANITFFW